MCTRDGINPLCYYSFFLTESNNGVDCKDNESTVVSELHLFPVFSSNLCFSPANVFIFITLFIAFSVKHDGPHGYGGRRLRDGQHHRRHDVRRLRSVVRVHEVLALWTHPAR